MCRLVSVIVPVYNIEHYIAECIDSLKIQSYENLEIILVDDGSTDLSGEICDQYATEDQRIRVIHKSNGGLSDARNTGIDAAGGEFLAFVDGDDILAKDAILVMVSGIEDEKGDISVCNMIRLLEDKKTESFYEASVSLKILDGTEKYQTLLQPSVCNKMFKAHLFEDLRFPKGKFYEDTFIYHMLAYQANRIVLTGYDGYFYRYRAGSILGGNILSDQYFDFVEAVWQRTEFLLKKSIQPYGNEACLSLYAAYANAEKNIPVTEGNKEKHRAAGRQYLTAYVQLMHSYDISIKQKIRLLMLRYCPWLHSLLY